MGWFWADSAAAGASRPPPSHARTNAEPPPGCPMHKTAKASTPSSSNATASACPYPLPAASDAPPPSPANASPTPSYISKLNPLNYMPSNISNRRESSAQAVALPLDREASSIPRGDGAGNWEYPSPQQMYNAMLRKGYTDTPAEHVESMVAVHNFLNEGAWEEIKAWEARFGHGLARGWERCRRGEERATQELALEAFRREHSEYSSSASSASSSLSPSSRAGDLGAAAHAEPKLLRFMGRPSEPTPKARVLSFMAWLYPSQFPDNPPFDRHDWFVQRQGPAGATSEVRYVIDYYSGPPEPTGEPVFYLDVRPALDGPTAACERLMRWGGDVWYRASGASVREELQRQKGR